MRAPRSSSRSGWHRGALAALAVAAIGIGGCARAGVAPMPQGDNAANATLLEGRTVWIANCARCHGPAGTGGAGPRVAGKVVAKYPDPAAQATVISNGRGVMPAFKNALTPAQIDAVVQYTRVVL